MSCYKTDFSNISKTVSGLPVKEVRFVYMAGIWFGMVQEGSGKWVTCNWNKLGKCKNPLRQDCNLI